jgi:hypothetical protein
MNNWQRLKEIASKRTPGEWSLDQEFGLRTDILNSCNEPTALATEVVINDGRFAAQVANNWHLIEAVIDQARATYTGGDLIKLRGLLKALEEGEIK